MFLNPFRPVKPFSNICHCSIGGIPVFLPNVFHPYLIPLGIIGSPIPRLVSYATKGATTFWITSPTGFKIILELWSIFLPTGKTSFLPATVNPPINAVPSAPNLNLFLRVAAAFAEPVSSFVSSIAVFKNFELVIVVFLLGSLVTNSPTPYPTAPATPQ